VTRHVRFLDRVILEGKKDRKSWSTAIISSKIHLAKVHSVVFRRSGSRFVYEASLIMVVMEDLPP
jgi:hypothetical protein